MPGDHGAHGTFDARAREHSLQLWADTHRGWLALAGLSLTGVLWAALSRDRRSAADAAEKVKWHAA